MHSFEIAAIKPRHVTLVAVIFLILICLSMVIDAPRAREILVLGDNDDILRWMSVKDWLAGQGWFDMSQHRVEPPEGLSLHWSRYLDAAIAGTYSLLALFLTPTAAETWTLMLWPNMLLVLLLVLVAKGTGRVLGSAAMLFAMLAVMTWMPLRGITFTNGRIDHHNVQILLMTCVTMAMIWQGSALRTGLLAGLAAAFSLAIGLEMLVFVAVAGIMLFLRAAFDVEGAKAKLAGFCITLLGGSLVFFAGQTAPSQWLQPHCDQMSTPFLAILLIATASCGAPLVFYNRLSHPAARIGITAALTLAGLWVFAALIAPCLAGPYGMLPPEVQEFITTRISEALPGLTFAQIRPLTFVNVVLPICVVTGLGTWFWATRRDQWQPAQRAAIGQMLVFGWMGLLGSLIQIRMNIIAAPALPFLAGFVFTQLLGNVERTRRIGDKAIAVLVAIAVFFVQATNGPSLAIASSFAREDLSKKIEFATVDKGCRDEKTLAHLDTLPRARMLTMMGLGADLLLATHHDALSVPYQRGAYTFWNGSFPFRSQELMLRAISQSKPDYVVLCHTSTYSDLHGFARDLNEGALPDWLRPVDVGTPDLLVLQVVAAKLP